VVDLPESATTNTVDALSIMAEAGVGIAFLPDFLVADAIANVGWSRSSKTM
jgi:DNA-binding transcriptional LysR family regulator